MKTILCYGDSNTWGYIPGSGARYGENIRWPERLRRDLGEDYRVIEAGINGRTTAFDDPLCDCLNGRKGLPYALMSAKPIDLLILSLGTNDLKFTDARGSSKGLEILINLALSAETLFSGTDQGRVFRDDPNVLVVSPIALNPGIRERIPSSSMGTKYEESLRFQEFYQPVCDRKRVFSLNGAAFAAASSVDCIHMDEAGHRALENVVLAAVMKIFAADNQ